MSISRFMDQQFRHFNARETLEAARGWNAHLEGGGKMLLTLAGAMSTAEIGISLSKMIRAGKVHAISCTAANLEEDIFNLVAHDRYKMVPHYRDLSPEDELELRNDGFNRVTDTCIPETVIREIEDRLLEMWVDAAEKGETYTAAEYFYRLIEDGTLERVRQIAKEDSWLWAAYEAKIPIYSPGFEDSTLGNIFAAHVFDGSVKSHSAVATGTAQMESLVRWYLENVEQSPLGFFQIGGGIAGDFAICVVPLIVQDLQRDVPLSHWLEDPHGDWLVIANWVPAQYELPPEDTKAWHLARRERAHTLHSKTQQIRAS